MTYIHKKEVPKAAPEFRPDLYKIHYMACEADRWLETPRALAGYDLKKRDANET
jgi:hypothetical protein